MSGSQTADWWRNAVVYQVYPRSFADANGDGLGDIPGVTSRVPYLRDLGVDAVWLSPFYPSPLADGGYDIVDYRDVDPRLGTLDDLDMLISRLHESGIRLIIDIVPNHSSSQHPWFQAALSAAKGSPERERYIFQDGRGADGSEPPSDWMSHFGGSAWERTPDGQFYLHLFAPEQPDYNWENPDVREEFRSILEFWCDRGVDGFRIDVAHALVKDLAPPLRSQPNIDHLLPEDGTDPLYDRDDVHDIYRSWRAIFDRYDPPRMGVAEAWVPASRRVRYATPEGLGQAFNFDLLQTPWDALEFGRVIEKNLTLALAAGSSSTWVLSNHDVVRHPSRYALAAGRDEHAWLREGGPLEDWERDRGLRRARAATLLVLALPGSTYLYQGEELGLPEVTDLPEEVLQDPIWRRTGGRLKGRDGCRVPLPWSEVGESFGFGGPKPHLPQPAWFRNFAVSVEERDENSTLHLYRRAIRHRRELIRTDKVRLHVSNDLLHIEREGGWHSVTNFGLSDAARNGAGAVVMTSDPAATPELIPAESTVWFRVQHHSITATGEPNEL